MGFRNIVLRSVVALSGAAFFTVGLTGCPLPSSTLNPWPGYDMLWSAPNNTQHWLILKCTFSDDRTSRVMPSNEPAAITDLDSLIGFFLSLEGIGTGNLLDYWHDVTYGGTQLETTIKGWYDAPFPSNNSLNRRTRIQQCANAVPANDVDFSQYDGIVMVTNKQQDGGAGCIGKCGFTIHDHSYNLGAVVFDGSSMYTAFASHEMGHGLGLVHSFDDANVEYGDQFDIMSALNTNQFTWDNFPGGAGPGANLPNLLKLNAIPSGRLATYTIGQTVQTYTISALSHGSSSHPLGVQIFNPQNPSDLFTVEYRSPDGWDQGMPANGVVAIHEFKETSSPWSFLQEGTTDGAWGSGSLYINRDAQIIVSVQSIDTTNHTATINVNSFSN